MLFKDVSMSSACVSSVYSTAKGKFAIDSGLMRTTASYEEVSLTTSALYTYVYTMTHMLQCGPFRAGQG